MFYCAWLVLDISQVACVFILRGAAESLWNVQESSFSQGSNKKGNWL